MTGVAPRGEESREGEEVSAECRALQAATTVCPIRGRSFHVSARTRAPDSTKAIEELEAQTTPKTQEPEEPEAQEEVEAYHTRREGPHVQMEDRERWSTTRPEASPLSNPAEFRTEEDTVGEGRQDVGRTKTRKGLTEVVTRGSRPQGTDGGIVPWDEGAPPNSEPSASKPSQGGVGKGRDCCQDTGGSRSGRIQKSPSCRAATGSLKRERPSSRP